MTAVPSSVAPIDNRDDLINAILELPEKDFCHLVDIRLNRPKGFRPLTNIPIEGYVQIIDANDKPSIVERWTSLCLQDHLFIELATTKNIVSHNGTCGITVHKYYNQAFGLRKWILFTTPAPKFVINLSDLSAQVIAEIMCLEDPQQVLKQAVGRIFENIDELEYHQSIARKLKIRLAK